MATHTKKHVISFKDKDFIIFYDDRLMTITEVKKLMRHHINEYVLKSKQTTLL